MAATRYQFIFVRKSALREPEAKVKKKETLFQLNYRFELRCCLYTLKS